MMNENHVKDRWCFNMWLEPERLALPAEHQSLYTAREVVQAVPLYVRPGVNAHDFLRKNVWAKKYFARGWEVAYKKAGRRNDSQQTFPQGERFRIDSSRREMATESFRSFDTLNTLAWKWQKRRMKKGKTTEVVAKNQAFFHPRDTRSSVKAKYERICSLLELKPYA
jgi:hypothetical protein